jgi:hypothetical protein
MLRLDGASQQLCRSFAIGSRCQTKGIKEMLMRKSIASLLGAAMVVVTVAGTATDASAQWRGRGWGWGWGPGIAAGVVGGAIVAGAIIASRPPGYVVYEGYPEPVSAPGCYWASRPVYDGAGRVVGYSGQAVQVCPGYSGPPGPPPAGYAGPPPGPPPAGYAGGPGAGPAYAGGPPPGDPTAYCAQKFHSYDPRTGTYLGNDGQRHPCP